MIALVQRVLSASVRVDEEVVGAIGPGLLVLLGVVTGDTEAEAAWLAAKAAALRIFPDDDGRMNRSLLDTDGAALVVSQFTLAADTSRGNRPGFSAAAPPEEKWDPTPAFWVWGTPYLSNPRELIPQGAEDDAREDEDED